MLWKAYFLAFKSVDIFQGEDSRARLLAIRPQDDFDPAAGKTETQSSLFWGEEVRRNKASREYAVTP